MFLFIIKVAPKKARNFASIGMGYVMIENSLAGVRKKKDDWNSAVSLSTALLIGLLVLIFLYGYQYF